MCKGNCAEKQENGLTKFSACQLRKFDGKDGAPSYIAINGKVYDITNVHLFKDGKHYGVTGGKDVSKQFVHKPNILGRLTVVGELV